MTSATAATIIPLDMTIIPQVVPLFSGSGGKGSNKANAWIRAIERFAKYTPNCGSAGCLQCVEMRLIDVAEEWYTEITKRRKLTWHDFKDAFLDRWGEQEDALLARLSSCRQEAGESAQEYADRFRSTDREEEPDGVRVSEGAGGIGAVGVGTAPRGRSAGAAASRGAVAPVGATAGHLKETSGPKGVIRRSAAGSNSGQQSAGGGGSKRAASKRQRDGRGKTAGPTPAEVFAESFPQAAAAVQLERKRGRSARH